MNDLPRPEFVPRDPEAIVRELVAQYEAMAGRSLEPAQVERLLIDLIAYQSSLLRQQIQETGEQNLLAFARFPALDWLGEFYGVTRLPARGATTRLAFTRAEGAEGAIPVPAGTRVRSKDDKAAFATDSDALIAADAETVEVAATATEPGALGNGYQAGEVRALVDPVVGVATAENVTVTFGGAEREDDDRLRARIRRAPDRLSVAGPVGAYRWHAESAHQDIVDVAVTSPAPGAVLVSVLTRDGAPPEAILDAVRAILSDDRVRPLTDQVTVQAPGRVAYAIDAAVTLRPDADAEATLAAAQAAAEAYAADRRAGLGRDVVPSQIVAALSVAGVYDVQLAAPAWRVLGAHEWADAEAVSVTLAGVADG